MGHLMRGTERRVRHGTAPAETSQTATHDAANGGCGSYSGFPSPLKSCVMAPFPCFPCSHQFGAWEPPTGSSDFRGSASALKGHERLHFLQVAQTALLRATQCGWQTTSAEESAKSRKEAHKLLGDFEPGDKREMRRDVNVNCRCPLYSAADPGPKRCWRVCVTGATWRPRAPSSLGPLALWGLICSC